MTKNGGDRTGGSRRRDVRRARKLARERQRAWDAIRAQQELDSPPVAGVQHTGPSRYGAVAPEAVVTPPDTGLHAAADTYPQVTPGAAAPATRRPALFDTGGDGRTTAADSNGRGTRRGPGDQAVAVLHPCAAALLVVVAVVGGTPVVTGEWDPRWLAGAGILALLLLFLYPRTWRQRRGIARLVGSGLGLLLVLGAGVGVVRQNVVEGRAQLRGSALDLAVDEHEELTRAVRVLAENQRLLSLPPEQAIPLGEVYAAARGQAIAIGERWNPATAPTPPVAELGEVYTLVNLAAAQQTAALDVFVANLENPEPALADEIVERGNVVASLVTTEIPAALKAADTAIREAAKGGTR